MNVQGVAYAPQQMPPNPAFYGAQNKGTLSPGQVIQIQSLTVTVERFLSQGSPQTSLPIFIMFKFSRLFLDRRICPRLSR